MDSNRHIQTGSNGVDRYEDEIELMDYILVIWKWKYLILGGTLAFTFVAAIISFIALKQQPTMYRTSIVLKPGVLEIDRSGHKVFIDTPENIKTLIENDLKFRVLEQNSNNIKLSTELDFQLDIPKGSNIINVSLVSALADVGTMKLNYLIKALSAEFQNKIKYIKNNKIEAKKIKIASHEANEVMARKKVEDNIKSLLSG